VPCQPAADRYLHHPGAGFSRRDRPVIDAAVDAALARCGVEVIEVDLPGWNPARRTCDVIVDAEAAASNRPCWPTLPVAAC